MRVQAGFKGPVFAVNPKYDAVEGVKAYRRVSSLPEKLIRYCRERGTRRIVGQALPQNIAMRPLAKTMGFREEFLAKEGTATLTLELQ